MATTPERIKPMARLGAHEGRLTGDYPEDELTYWHQPVVEKMRFMFDPVMQYNRAHVVMLTEQGILDSDRARKLLRALQEIQELGIDNIDLDPRLQGIYPNTEALVIDKIGYNAGGMLYLGRTRADVHNVPQRMAQRQSFLEIMADVLDVRRTALDLAAKHCETLMPGYTHQQHAQPMTFGFYMAGFAEALEADFDRLMDAFRRLNMSSAEVGVGMTTTFPVNRHRVAELLGFEGMIENALFATRSLDRDLENLSSLWLLALSLYRLAEDFMIWCSSDVKFMELDDTYSATSFLMAQKKNPIGLHHTEAAAIVVHGHALIAQEVAMRNTSEAILKGSIAIIASREAIESITGALKSLKGFLPSVVLHQDRMQAAVAGSFTQATEVTDALVRETGISFREAHRVIGTLVRSAISRGIVLSDITVDLLAEAAQDALGRRVTLGPETLKKMLSPMETIREKRVFGGPAPDMVHEAIERRWATVHAHEAWLLQKQELLQDADRKLAEACAAILASDSD